VTSKTELSKELHRLEILNILRVEEHVSDNSFLLVDSQRIASEYDSLEDDL
jgi:hypothetical protein